MYREHVKLKNFGVRALSNVAIFKVVTIGGDEGWSEKRRERKEPKDNDKKTMTKKDKDKNTDSEEWREPKQGPGSFARSVSTVSTAHNAYNTFLDPLTWPLGASKEPIL